MKLVWLLFVVMGWAAVLAEKEKLTEAKVKGTASEEKSTYEIKEKLWLKDVKHEVVVSWIRIMLAWIGHMAATVWDFFLNFGVYLDDPIGSDFHVNISRLQDGHRDLDKKIDLVLGHLIYLKEKLDPPKPQSTAIMIRRTTCYAEGTPEHLLEALQFTCDAYIESILALTGHDEKESLWYGEYIPCGWVISGLALVGRLSSASGFGGAVSYYGVPKMMSIVGFGVAGVVQGSFAQFLQGYAQLNGIFTSVFAYLQAAGMVGINTCALLGVGAWVGVVFVDFVTAVFF